MQGWPAELRDQTLQLQFHAQRRGYREQFPCLDERLILADGSPIGWIIVDRSNSRELYAIDMALIAGARQQGVGSRVLRALQKEAASGNRPMVIFVERRNTRALAFHHRLGFLAVSETDTHTTMEWRQDPQP